ncbi:MAG: hypothetical protein ACTHK7_22955 [Aureliella sp.]
MNRSVAQDIDGLVNDTQALVGKPIRIQQFRGAALEGELVSLLPAKAGGKDVQIVEVASRGRSRKVKANLIASLQIDGRAMALQPYYPSGQTFLVDLAQADAAADERLTSLGRKRNSTYDEAEYERLTRSSMTFAASAARTLGASTGVVAEEGTHVIVITDYPAPQRPSLMRTLDQLIPKLNAIFGFREKDLVLPGKPIVAAFLMRENLGKFQSEVVGYKSYGTIRAFFQIAEEHPIITAEDETSPRHMIWQAAWGLSGAYSHYSYSNVVLPAWVRVGLQQHCSDVLVPRISDLAAERRVVFDELKSGSLNGIMNAENLPGERQLVCKFLVAHLYKLSPGGFGQMLNLMKLGRNTDEALEIAYAIDQKRFAASFGQSLGLPGLTP